jgi:Protein of unknown function (DUF2637)
MHDGTERPGPRTRAGKWTARLGLAGVALIGAVVSYTHALPVILAADGHGHVSYFIPLLADLLIATATANVLDAMRNRERVPRLSLVAGGIGVVVTLGMNVASGSPHMWPPWLVNAWPPVAFVLALESFAGHIRRGRGGPLLPPDPGAVPVTSSHVEPPAPPTTEEALAALLGTGSQRHLAAMLGVPRSRVEVWGKRLAPVAEEPPAGAAPVAPAGALLNGEASHA